MSIKGRLSRLERRVGGGSGEPPVLFYVIVPGVEVPDWASEVVRPLLERDSGGRGGVLFAEWHRDAQSGELAASWPVAGVVRWYRVAPDGCAPMEPPIPVTISLDGPQGYGDG